MVRLPSRRVCWYGKLPARGDFVGRGLPPRWRSDWDGWLQRGLALAATQMDGPALRERLRGFAPWCYLVLPAPGEVWCGIVVPSHDRVGRAFPLTLAERLATPAPPHDSAERLASLLDAAMEGPEALEAAIDGLPPRAPSAFEPSRAWPSPPASLWWAADSGHDAPHRTGSWPPEPALVLELLDIRERAVLPPVP
ncbi:type VI secretion system-associated protein TagF [Variovorax sp. KK3]|uniref:type VI secretion system-associated protein TagF n=1 Tax=Variovorax sp. KK3 TaxID=1855728 RepID=UPI00097BE589|nr:type VI secretion system-associated protein TagF [Variovorax sp. KK3]